jgi:hypothetical protein
MEKTRLTYPATHLYGDCALLRSPLLFISVKEATILEPFAVVTLKTIFFPFYTKMMKPLDQKREEDAGRIYRNLGDDGKLRHLDLKKVF